jgi:hypothetical protein
MRNCTTARWILILGLLLRVPAFSASADHGKFSTLQGIQAQPMSADEMKAVSGELNALDIAAALRAAAQKLDKFPKLQEATIKLADYYTTNADAINAAFMKLGIFTPCQSCTP